RVPQNCPATYSLMAHDPDVDSVRCRYGVASSSECYSCYRHPNFHLDERTCTLSFNGAGFGTTHVFELVLEDFPRQYIILRYGDGTTSTRIPFNFHKKHQSNFNTTPWRRTTTTASGPSTTPPYTWWWKQPTSSTAPTTTAPTTSPQQNWWWYYPSTTTTAPRTSPQQNWWWDYPSTTTTAPSTSTQQNWWWYYPSTTTTAPRTSPQQNWWWYDPSTTTTAPRTSPQQNWWWYDPSTTTTAPRTSPQQNWWWYDPSTTTTAPRTSPQQNWWWYDPSTTTTAPSTSPQQNWWWYDPSTTTTAPSTSPQQNWWWYDPSTTTTAPSTSPQQNWWWYDPSTTTTAPSTSPQQNWWWYDPSTTTTAPSTSPQQNWWWYDPSTTTTAPSTSPQQNWWWYDPSTTTTAPSTSPQQNWWWYDPSTTTTAPSTSPQQNWWWYDPSTTTTAPSTSPQQNWWWYDPSTTTTAPSTSPQQNWWWYDPSTTTTAPTTSPATPAQTTTTTAAPTTAALTTTPLTTTPFTTSSNYYDPLSKIPLQFVVQVDSAVPSCNFGEYRPEFLAPTPPHGIYVNASVGHEFQIPLRAAATRDRIYDIKMSGPLNITKSLTNYDSNSGVIDVMITWTPTENDFGEHIPICFIAETASGYQSEMRCIIVVVVNEIGEADIECTDTTMTLYISKSSVRGLHENHLRLNDPTCSVTSNGSHIIASVSLNSCGTKLEETENDLIFRNEITSFDHPHDIITRKHQIEIPFICKFPKKSRLSASFKAHKSAYLFTEAGFGSFTYLFEFYDNSAFSRMINPNTYPIEVELQDMIYMGIQVQSSLSTTQLFVESCRATPNDNPNDPLYYDIISNGNEITSFDHPHDIITRKHQIEIPFICKFPKKSRLLASFKVHKSAYLFTEAGFGSFTYLFEFYDNSAFSRMINPNTYPIEVELQDMIYMGIQVQSSLSTTQLFVESCRATPNDNPNDPLYYDIISNGCIEDETTVVYLNNQTDFRFGLEAFNFIGNYEQVFISCTVILCVAGDPNNRCAQGCTNGTSFGHHHRKRSLASQSQRHFISQGPLRFARSSSGSPGSNLNLNLNILVVAVTFFAAVALVCGVLIYKVKMAKIVKYETVPSADF
ncbi:UNVERIFIED_CONTAM: hypothetical protein FKN15_077211, partial [Acipenser sinensis]